MNVPSKSICLSLVVILTIGCAGPKLPQQSAAKPKQQEGIPAIDPALRMADHHEWVKRLLAAPPVQAIQLTSGSRASEAAYPIPLLPTVGTQYSLKINPHAQLVWLQTHGYGGSIQQVNGPWKMDQPDAAHLLHSITNPPGAAPQAGS